MQSQLTAKNPVGLPDLTGKVALVTGGSRGIGKAIVLKLAAAGATIASCSRTDELNLELDRTLKSTGTLCVSSTVDVTSTQALEAFIARCRDELGEISILVNNAGVYLHHPVSNHSLEQWKAVLDTNLSAAMITSRAVIPDMIKQGWGRVINIASISGKVAEINGSAYSASKFGLIGLTQSSALETAKYGITVNAVCPGWVRTDLSDAQIVENSELATTHIGSGFLELEAPESETPDGLERLELTRLSIPQERFIEPDEIAQVVLFLCSHGARGITGQSLNVCGGLSLH